MGRVVKMIMSDRDEFLGAHTTDEVKKALEAERKKSKKSVSLLVHEAVAKAMKELGYDIKEAA
jgi:hypothetical protein